MSETNAAPAGDSQNTPVTATMQEPMTVEAAAGLLAGWDDEDAKAPPAARSTSDADEAPDAPDTEPAGEDGEVEASAEPDEETPEEGEDHAEEPEAENQSEPEGIDWEKVPGNAKFRLRDGTVATAADIKAKWDELQQASQLRETYEKNLSQFEQQRAQAAQQYQQFLPVAQQALQVIQASLPQVPNPPDPNLAHTDPIRYVEEKARHDAIVHDYNTKVGQMRQIQAQAQAHQQRAEAEQKQRLDGYIQEQHKALLDAIPELRDTAKRREFAQEFTKYGTEVYGFKPDELGNTYDARILKVFADAMAYRKLKAKGSPKPNGAGAPAQAQGKPAEAPTRAPIAKPGARTSAPEKQAAQRQELLASARRKGKLSQEEAASLFRQLDR